MIPRRSSSYLCGEKTDCEIFSGKHLVANAQGRYVAVCLFGLLGFQQLSLTSALSLLETLGPKPPLHLPPD
jgi:hypothetical protein